VASSTPTNGMALTWVSANSDWEPMQKVAGPTGASDLSIAVYDGTTGNLIKDSGIPISSLLGFTDSGNGTQTLLGTIQTTNATPANIITYPSSANTTSTNLFARVVGMGISGTASGLAASYILDANFRQNNSVITQVGDTNVLSQHEDVVGWDAGFIATGTNIMLQVTGSPSATINWRANVSALQNQVINFKNYVTSVTIKQCCQSDLGITLDPTLRASGSSPPVVTITGSLPIGIRVEITTGGALGVALYRYSADAGVTWIESELTTTSTYAMIGAATGITLNFPTGTYTNDNVYVPVILKWADQSGNGYDYVVAAASVAYSFKYNAIGGFPSLASDQPTSAMVTSPAMIMPSPGTTPWFCWCVVKITSRPANVTYAILASNNGNDADMAYYYTHTGVSIYNASLLTSANGALPNGTWSRCYAYFSASTADFGRGGAQTISPGTSAGSNPTFGTRQLNTAAFGPGLNAQYEIVAVMYTLGAPTTAELAALDVAVIAKYGTGVLV
jgi:hypothetical protein